MNTTIKKKPQTNIVWIRQFKVKIDANVGMDVIAL
jgi:hypothetical protein